MDHSTSLIPLSEEDLLIDKEESLTSQPNTQSTVDRFLVSSKDITQSSEPSIKELSGKLDKVLNLLSVSATNTEAKSSYKKTNSTKSIPGNSASNISEFLDLNKDIELVGDSEDKTVHCKICFFYLNSKSALQRASHLPSSGCVSTGLLIRHEAYQHCVLGHNSAWYRLRERNVGPL